MAAQFETPRAAAREQMEGFIAQGKSGTSGAKGIVPHESVQKAALFAAHDRGLQ
jgi:hypothetical protein